jgi:hypothetical protein
LYPTYIILLIRTLKIYTIRFKQFPTGFDAYYIILRGVMLEHWRTAESSQSSYLQVYKIVAVGKIIYVGFIRTRYGKLQVICVSWLLGCWYEVGKQSTSEHFPRLSTEFGSSWRG